MPRPLRIAAALAALVAAPASLGAPDRQFDRGRELYELRCQGCHGQSVHSREKRAAADFESVRDWVARWSRTVGAGWAAEEIDDVAVYLNAAYYRYPCPPTACKVISFDAHQPAPGGQALSWHR